MSAEIWSLIAVTLGTGATILIGVVSVMLKLWSDTNKRFDRQDERLDRQSERIEALAISLRAEIHALRTETNQRFTQIEQRFIQIDDRFIQIDDRFTQIEQRFDRLDERQHADISAVNSRLDALLLSQGKLAAALEPASGEEDAPPRAASREPAPAST